MPAGISDLHEFLLGECRRLDWSGEFVGGAHVGTVAGFAPNAGDQVSLLQRLKATPDVPRVHSHAVADGGLPRKRELLRLPPVFRDLKQDHQSTEFNPSAFIPLRKTDGTAVQKDPIRSYPGFPPS